MQVDGEAVVVIADDYHYNCVYVCMRVAVITMRRIKYCRFMFTFVCVMCTMYKFRTICNIPHTPQSIIFHDRRNLFEVQTERQYHEHSLSFSRQKKSDSMMAKESESTAKVGRMRGEMSERRIGKRKQCIYTRICTSTHIHARHIEQSHIQKAFIATKTRNHYVGCIYYYLWCNIEHSMWEK